MRFTTTVLSVLVATSVSAASSLTGRQYPDCTAPCQTNVDLHGCSPTDIQCLCSNQSYVKETTACFVNACEGEERQTALEEAAGLCESVGITLQSSDLLPSTVLSTYSAEETVSASVTATGADASTTGESDSDSEDAAMGLKLSCLPALAGIGLLAFLL